MPPLTPAALASLLRSRSPPAPASIPPAADAAAASYVAALALKATPPPPPRVALAAFFARARAHAAEARALASASALADPRETVARHAGGYAVSKVIWGKCEALVESQVGTVFGVEGVGVRDVWLLFLVAKSVLGMDWDLVAGSDVHAYHLLHAVVLVLREGAGGLGGLPGGADAARKRARVETRVDALCMATGALASEVVGYQKKLRQALPKSVTDVLPVGKGGVSPSAAAAAFEKEYQRMLDSPDWPAFIDERVFVDAPHLVAPLDHDQPVGAAASGRMSGKGAVSDGDAAAVGGVAAPSHAGQQREFAKFVSEDARKAVHRAAGNGDALDTLALAALASSAPHSPSVKPMPTVVPLSHGAVALSEAMQEQQQAQKRFGHTSNPRSAQPAPSPPATQGHHQLRRQKRPHPDAEHTTPKNALRRVFPGTPTPIRLQMSGGGGTDDGNAGGGGTTSGGSTVGAATPMTSSLAAVNWLQSLAESRPETAAGTTALLPERPEEASGDLGKDVAVAVAVAVPPSKLETTGPFIRLRSDNPDLWDEIITRLRDLCECLSNPHHQPSDAKADSRAEVKPQTESQSSWGDDPQFVREACSLYFSALESVFERESTRLEKHPGRVLTLLRSVAFHKSLLACALESTSAAYGNRRMQLIPIALHRFQLTPFDLSKCVETFVRSLPSLPAAVARHIAVCEHRLLEATVWLPASPLVVTLRSRNARPDSASLPPPQAVQLSGSQQKSAQGDSPPRAGAVVGASASAPSDAPAADAVTSDVTKTTKADVATGTNPDQGASSSAASSPKQLSVAPSGEKQSAVRKPVPEAALELFYLKFLAVASDRMQELLYLLGLDYIAEDVWSVIKFCSWDKWHLLVGRHVDQVIMCSVYGIAKVRQITLTFKDIIKQYRCLNHVSEPSFRDLEPGTFRDVSLSNGDPGRDLGAAPEPRGDIIKFYNQVFIHSTKAYLLSFAAADAPATSPGVPSGPPGMSLSPSATAGAGHPGTPAGTSNGDGKGDSPTPSTGATNNPAGADAGVDTSPRASFAKHFGSGDAPGSPSRGDVDRVRLAVLRSPMRVKRRQLPTRRIGSVTVSPMSRHGRSLASMRQSPIRRPGSGPAGLMTPATRKLYAFGESPSRNLDNINRTLSHSGLDHRKSPIRFDNGGDTPSAAERQKAHNLLRQRGVDTRGVAASAMGTESGSKGSSLPPPPPQ